LPGSAYTEKDGIYLNLEGRVQYARKGSFAPGEAREDWKILRALSEVLGRKLPYDTLSQLRGRIVEEFKHMAVTDSVAPAVQAPFGTKGAVDTKAPLKNPIKNYYLTNAIARASATMQACSEDFVTEEKMLEAAE
jgi:NADH-quinone oxidoreductase subunit G